MNGSGTGIGEKDVALIGIECCTVVGGDGIAVVVVVLSPEEVAVIEESTEKLAEDSELVPLPLAELEELATLEL